ncbi:tRNA (guanine(37)-N1)-methyltransferase 1 [Malania oleifera]|uniref:tRNA (guanine(37)-N1)-methyltransferase 1 n=1 Tax=Malania oleifera TaxID=397392 RepID=UPI0025AE0B2D|nr:tRNA (guanine(37)-N1)-methyltransferase 1 [Malania oleifera]
MAIKLILRPHAHPIPCFFLKPLLPKTSVFSLFSAAAVTTQSLTSTLVTNPPNSNLSYGPSLRKGKPPPQDFLHHQLDPVKPSNEANKQDPKEEEEEEENVFDESVFTRVFDLSAIRVPSEHCFALESRLRGHLLNWPRIRNVARVPGDDVDEEVVKLLKHKGNADDDDDGSLVSLNRRVYGKAEGDGEPLSPVLYRDKLANKFDSCGFMKFRNLAKMSRPKKKKKKEKIEEGSRGKKGIGKNDFAVVEVVEDGEEEGEDLSGLLGDGFKGRRWRGSTRLLLLDERYANKGLDDMPEAVKVLFKEGTRQSKTSTNIDLVRCKLTLFYNYWQMDEILEAVLPKGMIVPSAFETVGHIAHLNLRDEHLPYKKLIAKAVLDKNRPKIQTVVNKIDVIHNDYRTMQLEVLVGNHSLVTTVVENGIRFHVDLATVYWNSRLATERQRLVNSFTCKDIVCDVFSGVGPVAISAAKKVKLVYANDLNPQAVDFLERNSVLNKVERKIKVFNMDGRRFIDAIFGSENSNSITQVVMNLPNDAAEYLDVFRGIFEEKPQNKELTLPRIHVYGFSKARDPEFEFHERIRIALREVAVNVEMRRVRPVAPGKWMLCASFILPESVACARATVNK